MGWQIKIFGRQLVHNGVHELGAHEHAAKNGLLRFHTVGRHTAQQIGLSPVSGAALAALAALEATLPLLPTP